MKWKTTSKADFGLVILFRTNILILLSIWQGHCCALERMFGFNLRRFFPPSVLFPVELSYISFVASIKLLTRKSNDCSPWKLAEQSQSSSRHIYPPGPGGAEAPSQPPHSFLHLSSPSFFPGSPAPSRFSPTFTL